VRHERIAERVQALITEIAGPDRTPSDPGPETPLVDGGYWLDSVDLLQVVLACEIEFAVTFDPDVDFTPETLKTVGSLTGVIRSRVTRSARERAD